MDKNHLFSRYSFQSIPQDLIDELQQHASRELTIRCADARAIAHKLHLEPGFVGYVIRQLNLSVVDCELDCF